MKKSLQGSFCGQMSNLFYFEDGTGGNLLPADFWQNALSGSWKLCPPYVDKVLCYQYLGIMNKPDTDIVAGHPDSIKII